MLIEIQENEAFDRHSILKIKESYASNISQKIKIQEEIEKLEEQINISMGRDKAVEVFNSLIYKELISVNLELFKLFDKCKIDDEMKAKEPDFWNYKRHLIKNKLQEKFFGNKK